MGVMAVTRKTNGMIVFSLLLLMMAGSLSAQSAGKLRWATRTLDTLTFKVDTLPILAGTFALHNLPADCYALNYATAELHLLDTALLHRTITYSYRTAAINYAAPIRHKSTEMILPRLVTDPSVAPQYSLPALDPSPLFDEALKGTGSIARSLSVGNNQNFVWDAHLNLQLAGKLSPDVEILAHITDNNLPIQPEGNTRVLKDFNKIFINLKYKDILAVSAGDIQLSTPQNSYFLHVNRQFLGVDLATSYRSHAHLRGSHRVGGGLSKGKFVRQTLSPQLGVQGPYRLVGAQNETAIVIIAASERVYLDGRLLVRGEANDYVIDYNTGEITFTTRHLIAPEHRIVVEFEYSDRYYARYNIFSYNEFEHERNDRWTMHLNLFHEQDLKNRSLQPELNDAQMLFLSGLGDDVAAAIYPTASPISYPQQGELLYLRKDTLCQGEYFASIYVYTPYPSDSAYRVNFSYVGEHKGNYVISRSAVNGKVFEWVAPIQGVSQGNYEPVVQLNMPQMQDMLTLGASYARGDKFLLQTELGLSYLDHNLFSSQDDGDNLGMAYQLHLNYDEMLNKGSLSKGWRYRLQMDYELLHQNFVPLESFRDVEFARDYNIASDYGSEYGEQLLQLTTGIVHPTHGSTLYALNWLLHFGQRYALRNELNSAHTFGAWRWQSKSSYLFSKDETQRTQFVRTQNDISRTWRRIRLGVKEELEYNLFRQNHSDSLRLNSYAFNEAMIYVQNGDSSRLNYELSFKNRIDNNLYNNVLSMNTMVNEWDASLEFLRSKHHRVKGNAVYRNSWHRDSLRQFVPEHHFVGSIDYGANLWRGAVTFNLYYEAGTGLEQKRNYTFLKVAVGQGTHVWNDYNANGIEELDEFEVAIFQNEADYIKVWLATNEYVTTHNCGLTQSLTLRPANVWRSKQGFRHFLSLWSNHTMLRTYQKSTLQNSAQAFNPFQLALPDSVVVNQSLNFKNNLSFALPSHYFSAEYLFTQSQQKNLLYYGLEGLTMSVHQLSLRSVPVKLCVLQLLYDYTDKANQSQFLTDRTYRILSHRLQPQVTLRFREDIQTALLFEMVARSNRLGVERSRHYNAALDINYRIKEKGALLMKMQYTHVMYNSMEQNALAYEMLSGLTVGNNFLWNISYQTKLFEYLQINLQYEGRVTNDKRLIHTGFVQLKAMF